MIKLAMFDTKPYDKPGFDKYAAEYGVDIKYYEAKLTPDTVGLASGFDAVCVFVNDNVSAEVLEHLAKEGVKLVTLRCAGFNNVDCRAAVENGVPAVRVPAYSPYAVAEHAMALLLTLIRHTHKAYIRTRDFNFSLVGLTGFDLHGKTVGVIGTGRIGRAFIDICCGFGMSVLAYDPYPVEGISYVPLDTLLAESDIISLHCPLTADTHHIIDTAAIAKMKDGVVLVNTSRGALVDAEALLDGIKRGKIGGACLDVYEEEAEFFFEDNSSTIMQDDVLARLLSMPNVLISSHQAFLTEEALSNIALATLENLKLFFENGELPNAVCGACGRKCFKQKTPKQFFKNLRQTFTDFY